MSIEQRYGLTEMRTYSLLAHIKNFALGMTSFGGGLYRENKLQFGCGVSFSKKLSAGVETGLLNCWIRDYENRFTYTIKVGTLINLSKSSFDLWLNNINMPEYSVFDRIPLCYAGCFKHTVNNSLSLRIAMQGVEKKPPFFNIGLAVSPHRLIQFDTGINTEPLQLEYGFTLGFGSIGLNYSGSCHRQLGFIHSMNVNFGHHK